MNNITLNNPRTIRAWCMYDWANSVYNLVITTTFFPIYFVAITNAAYGEGNVPFFGRNFKSSALYDYALAFAYLTIALLMPLLSSIADSRGSKKRFMQFFCYMGGIACCTMFWFAGPMPSVSLGLLCFIFAAIGYVGSLVFYNSYLPEIAEPKDQDRISARGYSLGYLGSVLLQIVGFALVVYFSGQGDETSGPRYTFLLVGLWWVGFAQITFFALPNPQRKSGKWDTNFLTSGFIELKKVWHQLKALSLLKWFLTSFFFYSMGVQTVMLAATLFGAQVLELPSDKLIVTIVIIQLVGIAGAVFISRLSGKFGNLNVLLGIVLVWIGICVYAYEVALFKEEQMNVEYHFYLLAVIVGLVMGGVQSLSRSTYSKLLPETKDTASFFSFYDVTEKVAIVIGIFTFGYIDEQLGMKNSVLSLIVFFVAGAICLLIAKQAKSPSRQLV